MFLRAMEQENGEQGLNHLAELEACATEANHLRCQLKIPEAKLTLEQLILRSLWQLLHDSNPATLEVDIQRLVRLIDLGSKLNLGLALDRAQELYFSCLHSQIGSECMQVMQAESPYKAGDAALSEILACAAPPFRVRIAQLRQLLHLGQKLGVDVSAPLNYLP
jgi:hypothetical protein